MNVNEARMKINYITGLLRSVYKEDKLVSHLLLDLNTAIVVLDDELGAVNDTLTAALCKLTNETDFKPGDKVEIITIPGNPREKGVVISKEEAIKYMSYWQDYHDAMYIPICIEGERYSGCRPIDLIISQH